MQPLPFVKPACSSDRSRFDSRCVLSFLVISLSIILSHRFVREIGLWAWGDLSPGFFGIRHIRAQLRSVGISLVCHMCWTRAIVISSAVLPPFFSNSAAMLSGPGAFLFGNECMISIISSADGVSPHVGFGSRFGGSCYW